MNHIKPSNTRIRVSSVLFSLISVILLATAGMVVFSNPGPVKASSATLTFTPVADSYVNQSSPTSNNGTSKSLRVDGSPLVHAYLRFNISGIGSNTVSKITLRIYANSASTAGTSVVKVADNSWQETQITYNNAPTLGSQVGTSKKISTNTWVSIDVTSLLTADGTISIALVGIDQTAINLAARESGANAPQLLVDITTAATATNVIPTDTNVPSATATATATVPNTSTPKPTVPTTTNTPNPTTAPTTVPPTGDYQPAFPIRAAFYYPWFPEAWNQQGFNPFTNYTPSMGYYDSSKTTQAHISAMTYGNINAAILSWWGQGSQTDQRVATILGATPGSPNPNFRWSIYYENESMGNPSVSQVQSDLSYIQAHYGNNPSFLRVNGKFVIFVYADGTDACSMADRWVQADNALGHPAYIVLKVFVGYKTCASQPDSWHQYSPAVATDEQKGYSYAISPGFWKKGDAVRLARNMTTWTSAVKAMATSGDPWQLVTTFDEWGEGTSVESAVEWASSSGYGQYLDVLHADGNGAMPVDPPTATSQPTNPPAPSNTPTTQPTQGQTATSLPNPSATPTRLPSPTPTTTTLPDPSPTSTKLPTPTQTATTPPNPTATATQVPSPTIQPTQPSNGNDPILFYTSDLVSGGSVSRAKLVVNEILKLMGLHPGVQMLVASGGDNEQESSPTVANYQAYFGTTFGTFVTQGIFMQVRGNHDIQSAGSYTDYNGTVHSTGAAYWSYFGANAHAFNISGQMLTDYSYTLGSWHIIGLDQLNGSVNTATLNFLKSDLAAHSASTCQLVYWHVPTYSSGSAHGDSTSLKPLNQAEYDAGVDIQLNGHDHDYQRFFPLNPSGSRDDAKGITTFVAGIGGEDGRSGSKLSVAQAASAMYLDAFPGGSAIGVVQFTLHPTSADYVVYDANDGSVVDHGTVVCH